MRIIHENVGERIKEIRLSNGWTLEEMGKKLDTSKVSVYNWESGRNLPNKERLKAIAELGDITVYELLGRNKLDAIEREIYALHFPDLSDKKLKSLNRHANNVKLETGKELRKRGL